MTTWYNGRVRDQLEPGSPQERLGTRLPRPQLALASSTLLGGEATIFALNTSLVPRPSAWGENGQAEGLGTRGLYGVNGTMNPLCFSWLCKVRIEEKPTHYISKESSCITKHDCGG